MSLVEIKNNVENMLLLACESDDVDSVRALYKNYVYKYIINTGVYEKFLFLSADKDCEKIFKYLLNKKFIETHKCDMLLKLTNDIVEYSSDEVIHKYIPILLSKKRYQEILKISINKLLKKSCQSNNQRKALVLFNLKHIVKPGLFKEDLYLWLKSEQNGVKENKAVDFLISVIDQEKMVKDLSIMTSSKKKKIKI